MAKNTGLGRGLGALLGNNETTVNIKEVEEIREGEVVQKLKLIDVEPNKNQPRVNFDEESLEELATSIKQYGVIQPIIVTKKGNYYQIVAGERRWRASKKAGLTEIPAIVREYNEQSNKEVALIENIQRKDLNPIEKAMALKELMDKYNLTQQKISDMLGISRSAIANTLRLLNLDPRVIEMVMQDKLTEGHCRPLLAINDLDKQYETAKRMAENGDSVREAEKSILKKHNKKQADERHEAAYRSVEDSFRNFFGAKVHVNAGRRSGKIIIHYATNDELARLIELIK